MSACSLHSRDLLTSGYGILCAYTPVSCCVTVPTEQSPAVSSEQSLVVSNEQRLAVPIEHTQDPSLDVAISKCADKDRPSTSYGETDVGNAYPQDVLKAVQSMDVGDRFLFSGIFSYPEAAAQRLLIRVRSAVYGRPGSSLTSKG